MPKDSGKVVNFDPQKKRKLKSVDYVSPEKKEMLRQREREKRKKANRLRSIKLVGIFLLICIALYVLGPLLKI